MILRRVVGDYFCSTMAHTMTEETRTLLKKSQAPAHSEITTNSYAGRKGRVTYRSCHSSGARAVARTAGRRLEWRIRRRQPARALSLETFPFAPNAASTQTDSPFAELEFIAKAENIVVGGEDGVSAKTGLSCGLLLKARRYATAASSSARRIVR